MDPHRILDDDEVIKSSLVTLKNATGIPVTMYAEVIDGGKMQISHWVGLRTPAMHNLVIDSGAGVGGRVMSTRRPVGVSA